MSGQFNLDNFEEFIDNGVLARGWDYFVEGNVLNIALRDGLWVAEVRGSTRYTVTVRTDKDRNILATGCTCPYDLGPYCKHQAAVFYELCQRPETREPTEGDDASPRARLLGVLQSIPRDELVNMIMSLASADPALTSRIIFEHESSEHEVENARTLMQAYLNKVEHREYLDVADTYTALEGVEAVIDQAEVHPDPLLAIQLYRAALSVCAEIEELTEEAHELVNETSNRAMICIYDLTEDAKETLPVKARLQLFNYLIDDAEADDRCWDSLLYQRLEASISLCDLPECRQQLEQYLQTMLKQSADQDNDDISAVKHIQLALLERFGGKQEVDDFIAKNVSYEGFREKAIKNARQASDYQRLLQLAKDGCEADAGSPWKVRKWSDYVYTAYQLLGDKENVRRLAHASILGDDCSRLEDLKTTYGQEEWPQALSDLLTEMEQTRHLSSCYLQIVISENLQDKLIAYCQRHPYEILRLYKHFDQRFAEQVGNLFVSVLRNQASSAQSRSHYKAVCHNLKEYSSVCGKEEAELLRRELQQAYPRKRAFQEELRLLRF